MEELRGVFQKEAFFNALYGEMAFYLKPSAPINPAYVSEYGHVRCTGKFALTQKNLPMRLVGEWVDVVGFGKEFRFSDAFAECSSEREATDLLNSFRDSTSLRQKDVKRILAVTGADVFREARREGIEDEICAGGKADAVAVSTALSKIREMEDRVNVFKIFIRHGGCFEHVQKLFSKFPEEAMDVITNDPYRMYSAARIPFDIADKIAVSNGVEPLSEARLQAVLLYCIRRETENGNVYMTLDSLSKSAAKKGNVPATAVLAVLQNHPYIVKDDEFDIYYEKRMLEDEKGMASEFVRLMESRRPLPFHPEYIDRIEAENGRKLGNHQRSAFQLLTTTGFKLLTGDPGTGKTTTLNCLLRYLEMLWEEEFHKKPKFALCAPSGRASQRMKETTNRNALTIHKLIEYQPYGTGEYYKGPNDPIDADVLVVDEVSMAGLSTFRKLIAAVKSGCLVLLIGDTNQLQSVEPGSVLADIIKTGVVDRCHLTEVFRQAAESLINVNAKKVINGEEDLREGPDFELVKTNPDETQAVMIETAARLIEEAGNPDKVQVLAPMKKGSCGVMKGNAALQNLFNPGKDRVYFGQKRYRMNDRVIMMSNNYGLGYFNGDVGYIREITDSGMRIEIGEEMIRLPKEQYGDMELAYNCTIHKSQGSEYEYLIIVLQKEAKNMLDRNLLYTGITRGKKKVVVVYEEDAIQKSVRTVNSGKRNSLLTHRIVTLLRERAEAPFAGEGGTAA